MWCNVRKILNFQKIIDDSNRYIGRHQCTLPIYCIEKHINVFFEVDTPTLHYKRINTVSQKHVFTYIQYWNMCWNYFLNIWFTCHLLSSFEYRLPHLWQDIFIKMDDTCSEKHVALYVYYDTLVISCPRSLHHCYMPQHIYWCSLNTTPLTPKTAKRITNILTSNIVCIQNYDKLVATGKQFSTAVGDDIESNVIVWQYLTYSYSVHVKTFSSCAISCSWNVIVFSWLKEKHCTLILAEFHHPKSQERVDDDTAEILKMTCLSMEKELAEVKQLNHNQINLLMKDRLLIRKEWRREQIVYQKQVAELSARFVCIFPHVLVQKENLERWSNQKNSK